MRYIGIDPSFTSTGVVVISDEGHVPISVRITCVKMKSGVYRYKAFQVGDNILGRDSFISFITSPGTNQGQIGGYSVVVNSVVSWLECIFGMGVNVKVGIEVPMGAHMGPGAKVDRAFAVCCLTFYGVPLVLWEYTPGQIKKFVTGKGNAKKNVMIKEVFKKWGFDTNCDDIADAYGIAKLVEYNTKEGG